MSDTERTGERNEAAERQAIPARVVHETIRREGEEELQRSPPALAWSGLAAGLSMGFSLLAEGLLRAYLPDATWRPLVSSFGYSLGFLIVILGRQQLFTENTLQPILPLLEQWTWPKALQVLRLWGVVLATNLIGTILFAWVLGATQVVTPDVQQALHHIGTEAVAAGAGVLLLQGVFAGWLIALMVWLLPFAGSSRVAIIVLVTYVVGLGGFPHVIAGSVEAFYLVVTGQLTWLSYAAGYVGPTLLGNIAGGVALVALINHAQVAAESNE